MKITDKIHVIESRNDAAKSDVVARWAFIYQVNGEPKTLILTEIHPSNTPATINMRTRKYELTEVHQ